PPARSRARPAGDRGALGLDHGEGKGRDPSRTARSPSRDGGGRRRARRGGSRAMMGCDQSALEAWGYGEASADDVAWARRQVAACPACARELASLRAERRVFGQLGTEVPAPPSFEAILARAAIAPEAEPARACRPRGAHRSRLRASVVVRAFGAVAAAAAFFA